MRFKSVGMIPSVIAREIGVFPTREPSAFVVYPCVVNASFTVAIFVESGSDTSGVSP